MATPGVMSQRVPMTQEGYNKKKADVNRMENVEMPLIAEKIAAARDEGDLKENAEYHAQRENQIQAFCLKYVRHETTIV